MIPVELHSDSSSSMDMEKSAKNSSLWRYNSPFTQVVIIGLVCFCCPGMFNSLNGMGGGGQVDHSVSNNANTALYIAFAIFGVLGGGIYNLLGPRFTLMFGCSFYVLYAGSFLYYNHHKDRTGEAFVITAGGLLGMGAGLLWSGQGSIMMSYPPAQSRGRYISLFWIIFNLGSVLGGFLPFALNYKSESSSVNDMTYTGFMIVMAFGAILSLTLAKPRTVIRDDGTRVTNVDHTEFLKEGWQILKLFKDPAMILLAIPCIASNFFYTYQFNNVNGVLFNVRTRGLNNVFYWGAQMFGSAALGQILDHSHRNVRIRGFIGIAVVGILSAAVWGGGLAKQLEYSRENLPEKLDFKDSGAAYAGPLLLYFFYGLLDSMFQTLCYWTMGSLTRDAQKLSRYSGFYKGVQSAGAAIAWQVDEQHASFLAQLLINWSLISVSIPLLLLIMRLVEEEKDLAQKCEDELHAPFA